jgi:pimeloyl-ACP methyl ester carboxylesterase
MLIAICHPDRVGKLVIASSFYTRSGMPKEFWEMMGKSSLADLPQVYKDEFLKVNNDQAALLNMFNKDSQRMRTFKDWNADDLRAIKALTLIVSADRDMILPEHAVGMHRLIANSRLLILPGTHGSYMGEAMALIPEARA